MIRKYILYFLFSKYGLYRCKTYTNFSVNDSYNWDSGGNYNDNFTNVKVSDFYTRLIGYIMFGNHTGIVCILESIDLVYSIVSVYSSDEKIVVRYVDKSDNNKFLIISKDEAVNIECQQYSRGIRITPKDGLDVIVRTSRMYRYDFYLYQYIDEIKALPNPKRVCDRNKFVNK